MSQNLHYGFKLNWIFFSFSRCEMGTKQKHLMYRNILDFYQDDCRLKMRESLLLQGYDYQSFLYAQLSEIFKLDNKMSGLDKSRIIFETELCTNVQHVIAKLYKLLLKFEMEKEHVKGFMTKWFRNFGSSIQMNLWEYFWLKG